MGWTVIAGVTVLTTNHCVTSSASVTACHLVTVMARASASPDGQVQTATLSVSVVTMVTSVKRNVLRV